jgi:Laminin G domain/EGF-like domain
VQVLTAMCTIETGAAKATFNGQTSSIQYSYIPAFGSSASNISVTFGLRTRAVNATLMSLTWSTLELFLAVELSNGVTVVRHNLSGTSSSREFSSQSLVNDGQWHNVSIDVTHVVMSASVDSSLHQNPSNVSVETVTRLLNSSFTVLVGRGVSGDDLVNSDSFFKGCLDSIRINYLLLPFAEQLSNVTTDSRFILNKADSIKIGCHGDALCNQSVCMNNGTCVDTWNSFMCECVNGFNGTTCEQNIDDCTAGSKCYNGATCVDGIASYSCQCPPGYTGSG